jgi:thiamine biosynthesis lipoprotein
MDSPRRAWVEHVMGMPMSIHLRGAVDGPQVEPAVLAAYDELRRADALFSTYRDDSEVTRINAGELSLADAHPDVRAVAALCDVARDRTDGAFDAMLPRPDGGRWFDPSGLVKTWAAERAFAFLERLPGVDAYLGAAGDVVARSGPGTSWRIGIESPVAAGRLIDVVELSGGGLATSGTAARGAHLVDPRTGAPADALLSASVVGPSLMWADVYATAACVAGDDAIAWLSTVADYEGLVVYAGTGHVQRTAGWPHRSAGESSPQTG